MAVEIKKVTDDKAGMASFIRLPWTIYKNDPHWAPDLIMDLKKRTNKKRHPFFEFGDGDFFIAIKDGKTAGRIAALYNPKHNNYQHDKTGFWGFFECINDQETANALFDTVRAWLKQKGLEVMRGPMSSDTEDEIGMLYEGFDTHRFFMMPHNPPYYMDLCKNYKMEKTKDLIAFSLDITQPIPEKIARIAQLVRERMESKGFTFRHLNKKQTKEDFRIIMDIYEAAWAENWGFSPITSRQFNELAENMQMIAAEGLVVIIEGPNKEPVGMACSLYDYMECTFWARKFPFWMQETMQLLNLAWRLFIKPKPKFKRARLFLAGVMPKYRGLGLDAYLYVHPFESGKKHGIQFGELSWELEDNLAIIKPIEKMGGKIYKRMRIWDIKI
ncbi:MAG: N-acetyltransferase [bacterium]|nr:N-acetyltransferase [bacterium]